MERLAFAENEYVRLLSQAVPCFTLGLRLPLACRSQDHFTGISMAPKCAVNQALEKSYQAQPNMHDAFRAVRTKYAR